MNSTTPSDVTANPHTGKLADDVFHAVEMLHIERWNDEYETVLPEAVLEEALEAHDRYPRKRLIVHFMQPHRPYLGPTGQQLKEDFDLDGFNREVYAKETSGIRDENAFSALVERGEIPVPMVRSAYRENLDIVLETVEELVEDLSGKTVISADHGEMLGERITPFTSPKFGHSPEYFKNSDLFIVPWLEIESSTRRTIEPDEPIAIERGSEEEVEDRLQALGYC
ncbi:MAG: hypothetical protein U5K37_09370 [Natrialbaceae archaeon]|nr:hypothetical protein [Natrialbaceae archaeon]